MVSVIEYVREEPVVSLIQQFLIVRQVWQAVAAAFATSQERLDSFEVCRRCEASPRGRGVQQLWHHYSSEDSLQADVIQYQLPVVNRSLRLIFTPESLYGLF